MKSLIITSVYKPSIGGIESHLSSFVKHWNDLGHYTEVAVIDNPRDYTFNSIDGTKVHYIPTIFSKPLQLFKPLHQYIINMQDFDNIIVHDPHYMGLSCHFVFYKKQYHQKIFSVTHGGFFHTESKQKLKHFIFNNITSKIISHFHQVIAVSKKDYVKFGEIISANKLSLIENGVEKIGFNSVKDFSQGYRLVYFGRFSSNKRVHILVDVAKALLELTESVHLEFVFIGSGDDLAIKNINRLKANYPSRVSYFAHLDNQKLQQQIDLANIFWTASNYEGFGMTVVESMMSGLIPIVNNIEVLTQLVDHKVTGLVVDFSKSPKLIAEELLFEIRKSDFASLQEKAILEAETYSWKSKICEYEKVVKSVMEN
ncbi:glycosyltransferase family 4 protein [Neptunomonas sp.]|uniref:glycosyltransferase family 4 protein n=1 Tax=Neptunomonas sp. TaxID=1971898 RepID=UPI003564AABD